VQSTGDGNVDINDIVNFYCDGKGDYYDVHKLLVITKNNAVETMKVKDLKFNLDETKWKENMDNITEALENLDEYPNHLDNINNCDINDPILVNENEYHIIDGFHRFCARYLRGDKYIDVKFVNENQLDKAWFCFQE